MRAITASDAPTPVGGYSAGIEVDPRTDGRLLFVSGQTPERPDGTVAATADAQLRQVWANVAAVLRGAGAGLDGLVHVRTYLADRVHREINTRVRQDVLGGHEPALTVVICQLYEPGWVAEIEAMAVVPSSDLDDATDQRPTPDR